ncbi:MAG: TadE/TadG family type IV pilus assembly protein [Candidatus Dormibacteria bacterium]
MVEFALVGPLFFLLVLFIIEGALYVNAVIAVHNTTRHAARVAAICGSSGASDQTFYGGKYSSCGAAVTSQVQSNLGFLSYTAANINPYVTICTPVGPCSATYTGALPGATVEVDVVYNYTYFFPTYLGLSPTTQIKTSATEISQQ